MKRDAPDSRGRSRARRPLPNRVLKIVRRVHLYTGLLLLPWVIFFGFSGMLFNHPEWFGPVEVLAQPGAQEVGADRPDAEAIVGEIISQLNARSGAEVLRRVAGDSPVLEGSLSFQGNTESGERVLIRISPNHGSADVRIFPNARTQEKPDFHGERVALTSFDATAMRTLAGRLADNAGLDLGAPLAAVDRGGAEVRFQLESVSDGKRWNVSCQLADGEISARAVDGDHGLDFYSMVSRLHKTHHYPDRVGARWAWSAFADATGITMVFWGLSGLIMWWQLKPTRVLGVAGLSVAAVAALLVFTGTFADLTFGPTRERGGPAGGATNRPERSAKEASPPEDLSQRRPETTIRTRSIDP